MDQFVIEGGPFKVSGEYVVSGSKNACLPILASSLLFDKPIEIKNLANVKDVDTMLTLIQSLGKKIVQCHGVFDLLHIGHIRHFHKAKSLGDILIVTVTPDKYVNKGNDRPAFNLDIFNSCEE